MTLIFAIGQAVFLAKYITEPEKKNQEADMLYAIISEDVEDSLTNGWP